MRISDWSSDVCSSDLAIRTTFYSRKRGGSELQLQHARVVDLDEHTELKPMLKTNGTSLPGLRSGWFRLRNRHKALVAMGSGPRVLPPTTTQDYDLLLHARTPKPLLQRLRELDTAAQHGRAPVRTHVTNGH